MPDWRWMIDAATPCLPAPVSPWCGNNPTVAYLPLSGGTLTGPLILARDPVQPMEAATREYVDALLDSPAFTGIPTAPTATPLTSTTQLATTAFVHAVVASGGTFVDAPADGTTYGRLNNNWTGVLPLAGGTMAGPLNLTATGGTTARSAQNRAADVINVLDYGADPTGVADSAPAFRACMGSNRRIVVPPGTYLFNSTVALPSPYIAGMPPCVLAESLNNFAIEGYGANIILGTSGNRSCVFMFDRSNNFTLRGLTIQGNRTGLGSIGTDPNVGIFIMSCVNFVCQDLHMTGYYVYCFQGDWWVNGEFKDCTIDSAIYGFDVAYLYRCLIDHMDMTGSDLAGTGSAHIGNVGFSCIVDPNNSPYNYTGYAFSETQHVTLRNCRASNFNTGCYFTTGRYWTLQGNRWHDNPGVGSNAALGVFIAYDGTTSGGHPPSNIVVHGDTFSNNGAVVAGAGLSIQPASGSDYISDVTIVGCLFDNNSNTGISAIGANTNIIRLQSIGNTFTGAAQTSGIHSNIIASFTAVLGSAGAQKIGPMQTVTLGNNSHLQLTDANAGVMEMFVQADNNFIWNGTDVSGAARNIANLSMHSGSSVLNWGVPMNVSGLLTDTAGRILSRAATNSSVGVSDTTTAAGIFIGGGQLGFGSLDATTAVPIAAWANFTSAGALFITTGRVTSQFGGGSGCFSCYDGTHSLGMFNNGAGLAWGPCTPATGAPASLIAGLDSTGNFTAYAGYTVNNAGPTIRAGTGAATGTQPAGSLWLRTDGASGSRIYVSAGGGTWAAVTGV